MMPAGTDRSMLRKIYPTMDGFMKAIEEAGGQKKLSEKINVNNSTLYYHRKWLKEGRRRVAGSGPRSWTCDLKIGELDQRVKELYGSGLSDVKTYRLDEVSE